MKRYIWALTAVFCLSFVFAFGQEERKVQFEKTTHEFGSIKKGGNAEYAFSFTNVSDEVVKLSRVKASCGCTTPSWTKEPINPGASGEIKVKYNTNRVGPFTKTVTVTYDSAEKPMVLYIKGRVEADPGLASNFQHPQGGLSFDKVTQAIGTLDSDKEATATFKVKNTGPKPIRFTGQYSKEMMFDISPAKMELLPGDFTEISIKVHGNKFITPGTFNKKVSIYTDEAVDGTKSLSISGNINKVYSPDELAQMPNIEFDELKYDAGSIIEGEKVVHAFVFKNTGKDDLILESVKASCGCTATSPKDKIIKGGQTSEIVATFNSQGRQGAQNKSITVRTNDPDKGTVVLKLSVNVEKDPFHVGGFGPAAAPAGRR